MINYSIIIPAYNVADYLKRCVDSVLSQTYKPLEIIIVDDGSTDNTGALADEIAMKNKDLVHVIHQSNKGLGGARNTGMESAKGNYIIFIDSDDYVRIDLLEIAAKYIEENKLDIFVFNFQTVYEGRNILEDNSWGSIEMLGDRDYLVRCGVSACNKVFRKSIFTEGGIRFPEKKIYEDISTIPMTAIQAERIARIDIPLYFYYQRERSIINTHQGNKVFELHEGFIRVIEYYKRFGQFDEYVNELEFLAVVHGLYYTVVRIMLEGFSTKNILKADKFLKEEFPLYKSNKYLIDGKYIQELGIDDVLMFRRVVDGHYMIVYLRYFAIKRIKSIIKVGLSS